jgi:hypothetical protein
VNVAYGLGSVGFAAATAASARIVGADACFRATVGLLPWAFLLACGGLWVYTRRLRPDRTAMLRPGGFGQPP